MKFRLDVAIHGCIFVWSFLPADPAATALLDRLGFRQGNPPQASGESAKGLARMLRGAGAILFSGSEATMPHGCEPHEVSSTPPGASAEFRAQPTPGAPAPHP